MKPIAHDELVEFMGSIFDEDFERAKEALRKGHINEILGQKIADYSVSEFGEDGYRIWSGEVHRRTSMWRSIGIEPVMFE